MVSIRKDIDMIINKTPITAEDREKLQTVMKAYWKQKRSKR